MSPRYRRLENLAAEREQRDREAEQQRMEPTLTLFKIDEQRQIMNDARTQRRQQEDQRRLEMEQSRASNQEKVEAMRRNDQEVLAQVNVCMNVN